MIVKIRYKTDAKTDDTLQWRVIIDGIEHHASFVCIDSQTFTTKDIVEEGVEKWHITCNANNIQWDDEKCFIS
jgi:glycine/serine hydroxymethyltransferase